MSFHDHLKRITFTRVSSNTHALPAEEAYPSTLEAIHDCIDSDRGDRIGIVPALTRGIPVLRNDVEIILGIPYGDLQNRAVHRHNGRIVDSGVRSVSFSIP